MLYFNIILGRPSGYVIHMDAISNGGTTLVHPSLQIRLHGNPSLVPGRIENGVRLNGNAQYIDLGNQMDKCLGNLELCYHGLTISFWVKFSDFNYNMYILSTGVNGIRVYHFGGYMYITMDSKGKSWRVSLRRPELDRWYYLEMSWHPDFGLGLYLDNEMRDHQDYINVPEKTSNINDKFLIGAPNGDDTLGRSFNYATMEVDEMEIWYGRREELVAFNYIVRGMRFHVVILYRILCCIINMVT